MKSYIEECRDLEEEVLLVGSAREEMKKYIEHKFEEM